MVNNIVKEALEKSLAALGVAVTDVVLEFPSDTSFGDLSTNVALVAAKAAGMSPHELAEKIVATLEKPTEVEKIEIAGPGFINLYLTRNFFAQSITDMLRAGDVWGKGDDLDGKKVMVEYTDPNPFKPFHIGHLMSNAIGESLSRLVEFSGAEVRRANWQGDVGLHIARAIWGIEKLKKDPQNIKEIGEAYAYGTNADETNEDAKKEIAELNQLIYARDSRILDVYTQGREASLAHFEELYKVLGTKFDYYFFESEGAIPGRAMVEEGLVKGVFEESEGAVVYHGERHGLHTRVFLTKGGLPTYEAKELGLASMKAAKWDFDCNITVVAVEQDEYFKVVQAALTELRPELGSKYLHVTHGMMQLSSGKMSSRKGNVVTGESLIEDMREMANEKMKERNFNDEERKNIADAVAVAAIKYSILKQSTGKNIAFDPQKSLSFEGDSGPYLQYAHTRALSVLEKAKEAGVTAATTVPTASHNELERLLWRFPQTVERAAREYEPHHVATYLTELASLFNAWYAHEKILDGSPESPYKLALAQAFQITMQNGLALLGIKTPEKM